MNTFFNPIKKTSLLFILLFAWNLTYANLINLTSKHTYIENAAYYLDTKFDFKLTDEANEALRHGIALEIHTDFQLRLKREWLWDKTIIEKNIVYRLEYRPLANNFLTTNLSTGLRNSFSNLDAALNQINSISKMKLFDQHMLQKDKQYIARVKMCLDTKSLPAPLRPQAYFSSNWDISSKWLEWEVTE